MTSKPYTYVLDVGSPQMQQGSMTTTYCSSTGSNSTQVLERIDPSLCIISSFAGIRRWDGLVVRNALPRADLRPGRSTKNIPLPDPSDRRYDIPKRIHEGITTHRTLCLFPNHRHCSALKRNNFFNLSRFYCLADNSEHC